MMETSPLIRLAEPSRFFFSDTLCFCFFSFHRLHSRRLRRKDQETIHWMTHDKYAQISTRWIKTKNNDNNNVNMYLVVLLKEAQLVIIAFREQVLSTCSSTAVTVWWQSVINIKILVIIIIIIHTRYNVGTNQRLHMADVFSSPENVTKIQSTSLT